MSNEEEDQVTSEGVKLASNLDSALKIISNPLYDALGLFGDDRVLAAAMLTVLHFTYFMLAPRCLMWVMSSPAWYVLPAYSTMVAANKPGEPKLRALWLSYWVIIMMLRLAERMLLGWIAQTLRWVPLAKIGLAIWLMCETADAESPGELDVVQQRKDREAYRALDQAYRTHFKEDVENALNSKREGTTMENERRKRAVAELRARLKEDLEKTVARPRRYHAYMLIEPFLPNKAHASGPTFTDDRNVIRDRARKERKDKWLKHMKTMESEAAQAVALAEINRLAGNPIVEKDGSFIRYRKGETVARPLERNEKYLRFLDYLGIREHDRGPGEQVDKPFGHMATGRDGSLVRSGGTYLNGFVPDSEGVQNAWDRDWDALDEEDKRRIRSDTYLGTSHSRAQVGEYNYSRNR